MGSAKKPSVLVVIGTYLPGYKAGGPVRSVANLVEALGDEVDFCLVTSDRDLGESKPYPGVELKRWSKIGKSQVMYVPAGTRSLLDFMRALRSVPVDVLYLNSLFSFKYSILPLLMRQTGLLPTESLILAPRGELSLGALQQKRWKKWTYITVAKMLGVYQRLTWHASSQYEARDVRRVFGDTETGVRCLVALDVASTSSNATNVVIAGPLVDRSFPFLKLQADAVEASFGPVSAVSRTLDVACPRRKPRGSIRLVFLSRICRMKNLNGALSMLTQLSGQVLFTIYGPAEDREYWKNCQKTISALPPNIRVEYAGAISHSSTAAALSEHDVFLLPTLGENYGHVILEALQAGCPVVISDRTPWRDLEMEGVGWDLPLAEPRRFQLALQTCIDMGSEAFAEFSKRAREFGRKKSLDVGVLEQNRRLFAG